MTQYKNNRNVVQGRQNKANGKWFERYVDSACEYYKKKGLAVIDKTPEPMKPIRKYGAKQFIAAFEKKAQPDYKGILADGTSIIFEAKHTEKDRIMQSAVTKEQEKYLEQYMNMGAQCYVFVSFSLKDFFLVPFSTWISMKELVGHKYLSLEELDALCGSHVQRVEVEDRILKFLKEDDARGSI